MFESLTQFRTLVAHQVTYRLKDGSMSHETAVATLTEYGFDNLEILSIIKKALDK